MFYWSGQKYRSIAKTMQETLMGAQWGPCKLLAVPRGWSINDNVESDKVRLELWPRSQCPQGSAWLLRKRSVSSGLRATWGGLNLAGAGQLSGTVRSFSLGLCEGSIG